jgi:hypothetical protein
LTSHLSIFGLSKATKQDRNRQLHCGKATKRNRNRTRQNKQERNRQLHLGNNRTKQKRNRTQQSATDKAYMDRSHNRNLATGMQRSRQPNLPNPRTPNLETTMPGLESPSIAGDQLNQAQANASLSTHFFENLSFRRRSSGEKDKAKSIFWITGRLRWSLLF